jgi:hypothetical protein
VTCLSVARARLATCANACGGMSHSEVLPRLTDGDRKSEVIKPVLRRAIDLAVCCGLRLGLHDCSASRSAKWPGIRDGNPMTRVRRGGARHYGLASGPFAVL